MIEGRSVDLRRVEPADLPLLARWLSDIEVNGRFEPFEQVSLSELQRDFEAKADEFWFLAQKKDATPVGLVSHGKAHGGCWIGCLVVPAERGQGFGTEVIGLIVDYLFLHLDIGRIQCEIHPENAASQRMVERIGFQREGVLRKSYFSRGAWRDTVMFSILREEWGAPRILALDDPA